MHSTRMRRICFNIIEFNSIFINTQRACSQGKTNSKYIAILLQTDITLLCISVYRKGIFGLAFHIIIIIVLLVWRYLKESKHNKRSTLHMTHHVLDIDSLALLLLFFFFFLLFHCWLKAINTDYLNFLLRPCKVTFTLMTHK